ncbi:YitT family protein [Domibacillus robiginosus]|uniref:YitT family protein n=1 Tax=Domibacillus robiginosus TaxID=1071054 RepID=UPI00067E5E92|nr:YitT family protein [Domibacillus robiginosus]
MYQIKQYLFLVLGTFIIALCFNLLQSPNQIASGGLTGASLVLGDIFHLSSAIILWAATLVLLIGGSCFLGVHTILKNIIGSLFIPFFVYVTKEIPPLTHDPLLAAIYGGLGVGFGLAVVFRAEGNTGGFTLIAQILHQKKAIKHSTSILVMDAAVMIAGGIVFSPEKALYALVGAFVTRLTMDYAVRVQQKNSKVAYIISSMEFEKQISESILTELDRGLTKLSGSGGYTNNERIVMVTVLAPSKIATLKALVQHVDPHAFIILCEATEVFGEGFTQPVSPPKKLVSSNAI